jgi:biopolymer transport protein ExbD
MNHSVLAQTAMSSPLATASILRPNSKRWKRILAADLLLTALIDAFSILVIFLLMSFSSTGEILFTNKNMELPSAIKAEALERYPVVKLDEGKIFLEEKQLETGDGLFQALLSIRKEFVAHGTEEMPGIITVQADRRIKYEVLNQVVAACAQAGFSDIRFAVLMK